MKHLKTLSKRQILAGKIFITLALLNTLLFLFFLPTSQEELKPFEKKSSEIEIKVKGELHTGFVEGKELTLLHASGKKIGPARLVKLAEDGITLYLEKNHFEKSYALLSQPDWVLIPYLALTKTKGSDYEINY